MKDSLRQLLQERADALARSEAAHEEQDQGDPVVVVSLGAQSLGVPLLTARQIVPYAEAVPVPGAPPWLRGIIELQGELLSVLDLASFWKLGETVGAKHLLVVEGHQGRLGIVVSAIVDVRRVSQGELSVELGAETAERKPGVRNVTRDLVFILDVEQLLDHGDLVVDQVSPAAMKG
jgi:purine-binding chemotaxis protein CheW